MRIALALTLAVVVLVVSSAAAYRIVCLMPPDALYREGPLLPGRRLPVAALGAVLLLVGAVMALPGVPGQGVLMMLIGLVLLDIPWLRGPLRRLLGRPGVLRLVNRTRERANRPPLLPLDALP